MVDKLQHIDLVVGSAVVAFVFILTIRKLRVVRGELQQLRRLVDGLRMAV